MATQFDRSTEDYEALVADVRRSRYNMFAHNLMRWYEFIDNDVFFAPAVRRTELPQERFEAWYAECERSVQGMVGSGTLAWPPTSDARIGTQLALFRAFSTGRIDAPEFSSSFMYRDGNFDVNVSDIINQLFVPLSSELKRSVSRNVQVIQDSLAPASDRDVPLDHNAPPFRDTTDAVDKVIAAVEQSNAYSDADDKVQRLTELRAGRILLTASRVRLAAISSVLVTCLRYLANKFADSVISALCTAALVALALLFGIHIG